MPTPNSSQRICSPEVYYYVSRVLCAVLGWWNGEKWVSRPFHLSWLQSHYPNISSNISGLRTNY
jgi:hypothetical protein